MDRTRTYDAPWRWAPDGKAIYSANGNIPLYVHAEGACGRGDDYYACSTFTAKAMLKIAEPCRDLIIKAPEMAAELASITAERDRYKAALEEARVQLVDAKFALASYAGHLRDCLAYTNDAYLYPPTGPCTCGFEEALSPATFPDTKGE